jgi:predicted kinase
LLVVLSGLPGTGKSAIAEAIGKARHLPVLSVDPIESAILRADVPQSFETGLAAYLVAETLADGYMTTGVGAVVDAVNSTEYARSLWRALALKHEAELRIIVCVVSDRDAHRARLSSRDRGLASGEPTPEDVERRRSEWTPWPEPHLQLSGVDDIEANLAKALGYLG